MRSKRLKTASLVLCLMPLTACGSNKPEPTFASFPPAEDTKVEAKPLPTPLVFESEQAARQYDSDLEAWGERGWSAVARICRDAVRKGAPYPAGWCPAQPTGD